MVRMTPGNGATVRVLVTSSRRRAWTLAYVVLAVVVSGCAHSIPEPGMEIHRDRPKALIASYHAALTERDYGAVLACWAPRWRRHYKPLLTEIMRYEEDIPRTRKLFLEKWGPVEAYWQSRSDGETLQGFLLKSPFEGATSNGRLDWTKITVDAGDAEARVTIDAKRAYFAAGGIDGGWYVIPWIPDDAEAKGYFRLFRHYLRSIRHYRHKFYRLLEQGRETSDSFWHDQWPGSGSDYGERTSNVALRMLFIGRPDTLPGRPLTFMVGATMYYDTKKICWRRPEGGLGKNVVVEVDGAPIPSRDDPANAVSGFGSPCLTHWWSFSLPEEVADRLQPGEHTLTYTIISEGGTYKADDGCEVPILKGRLTSGKVKFSVE